MNSSAARPTGRVAVPVQIAGGLEGRDEPAVAGLDVAEGEQPRHAAYVVDSADPSAFSHS